MPAVFVHGNPETSEVWDGLRSELRRSDTVAVSMPGFGCRRPDDFGSSKEEYVDWLVCELEQLGEPVDVVGHDWGGFLTVRLASLRGDLLRSSASDSLEAFDERYEAHRWAQVWQTPTAGEAWVENNLATPSRERAAVFERMGVPGDIAPRVAGWFDQRMGESMLALYRSAVDIATTWPSGVEHTETPGLALLATADPFRNYELFRAAVERARARTVELEGLGHWWMLQNPGLGARVLEEFWASLVC